MMLRRANTSHRDGSARRQLSRSRWAAVGAAVAVSVGGGGLLTASAASAPSGETSSTVSIVPCRFLDTRLSTGERTTPIGSGETLPLPAHGTHGGCTIPDVATALVANVTTVNQSDGGYLSVFPSGADRPTISVLNWSAGDGATGNEVTMKLSAAGSFSVYNFVGTTDVVIDVVAYLVPASSGIGPKGDTGEAGQDGAVGPQGKPGIQGIQGQVGLKGDPGDSAIANLDCNTSQIARYLDNAWVCSNDNDVLATLGCAVNQAAAFDGSAWVCRSVPQIATLSRPGGSDHGAPTDFNTMFPTHSPNVTGASESCNGTTCEVKLDRVADHTTCSVTFGANPVVEEMAFTTSPSGITIDNVRAMYDFYPLSVTITCIA